MSDESDPVVVVPADLDVEDRIVGPVTFRLAGWLAAVAGGLALAALAWPAPAGVTAAAALAGLGLVGGYWRPGLRPVTWWARPVGAYLRRTHRPATTAAPSPEPPAEPPRRPGRRRPRLAPVAAALLLAAAAGLAAWAAHGPTPARPARPADPYPLSGVDPALPWLLGPGPDPAMPWWLGGDGPCDVCG